MPLPHGLPRDAAQTLCLAADADRRARIARRPDMPTAQQSLVSYALLRIAAARLLGIPARQVRIEYTDRGKPTLPGTGLYCSVSHTDGLCVCALSDEEVGVDAERIRAFSPRVARRVFSENEQAMLRESAEPDVCFFTLWTRRESFVKCRGTGLADIAATLPPDAHFQTFTWREKYVVSVCTFTDRS